MDDLSEIRKGGFVVLEDGQAVNEAIEEKGSLDGVTYSVTDESVFIEQEDLCRVTFYTLEGEAETGNQVIYLVVKEVGDLKSVYIYFDAPGFPQGQLRNELVDDGLDFLWDIDEQACIEDWDYSQSVEADLEDDKGETVNVTFSQKGIPLYGEKDGVFTSFVDYLAQEEFFNPEFLVLESGPSDESGVVVPLLGAEINSNEIKVY